MAVKHIPLRRRPRQRGSFVVAAVIVFALVMMGAASDAMDLCKLQTSTFCMLGLVKFAFLD